MNKKIIALIKPFDMKQSLYVYEDENQIDSYSFAVNDINDVIFIFVDKYDIQYVDLVGPKQYVEGIKKKIKEAESTKYNKNKLKINII